VAAIFVAFFFALPTIIESYEGFAGLLVQSPFEALVKLFVIFASLFILGG
jgi:hypothetical protein